MAKKVIAFVIGPAVLLLKRIVILHGFYLVVHFRGILSTNFTRPQAFTIEAL
jgi:hypothetical protein